jgi:hydrogenase expression/formation protein HypE
MADTGSDEDGFGSCPVPAADYERVVLGHGSGGRLSSSLLKEIFLRAFDGAILAGLEDQATLGIAESRIAITTDSFVVRPIFFPGGDIGSLAVHGTVNDLAVGGAEPRYLAAAFILEEGLPLADLRRVVASMAEACKKSGVELVTGDTKVVERGKGDQIFITTTGLGVVPAGISLSIAGARPGDQVLLSGTLGDHGVAILSLREGLEFETQLTSDSAPLTDLVRALMRAAPGVRCMRDPTRGGLASTLAELAAASGVGVRLEERAIPLLPEVRGACELLGLDPLHVANEGKLVAIVPLRETASALAALSAHPLGRNAARIGEIVEDERRLVVLESPLGKNRIVTPLAGEQLPRIC